MRVKNSLLEDRVWPNKSWYTVRSEWPVQQIVNPSRVSSIKGKARVRVRVRPAFPAKFFDGFPDKATAAKLCDNLDFQRAVEAYPARDTGGQSVGEPQCNPRARTSE